MTRLARLLCSLLLLAWSVGQSSEQMPTIEGESLTGSKVVLPYLERIKNSVRISALISNLLSNKGGPINLEFIFDY